VEALERRVDRCLVALDDLGAAPAVRLDDGGLDPSIASSRGSTPETAKKQVWRITLIRPARPASRAIRPASIA
jgi:hypothetical protein